MDTLYRNRYYQIQCNPAGQVILCDANSKPLVDRIGYQLVTDAIESAPAFAWEVATEADGERVVLTGRAFTVQVEIGLHSTKDSPQLRFQTKTRFLADTRVDREGLCLHFVQPVTEVFKRNRQRDSTRFQEAYWLDKQGAKFGKGSSCAFLYHTPGLSSLYLETKERLLWCYLDHALDHPQIGPDATQAYSDESASRYPAGSSYQHHFVLYLGCEPELFPRLTLHPHGHLATYVWTEHACYSDFRLHRALYYGSEDIHKPEAATGGFVKHGIPVTKSVFYANVSGVKNDSQSQRFTGPMVAIRDNPEFQRYLQDLHASGLYEICLHCPQPETSTHQEILEAMNFMKQQFDTVSWIDHIWLKPEGKTEGCCEGFNHSGLTRGSADMREIWKRMNTRYFWNCSLEYLPSGRCASKKSLKKDGILATLQAIAWNLKRKLQHRLSVLDLFYTYSGDEAQPTPLYWRHPTLYPELVSWPTKKSYHVLKREKRHTPAQLRKLIRNWGVCFTHGYPVYIGESNAAWTLDANERVVISPQFDQLLQRLASLRAKGVLHLSLIRDVLDYWTQLEQVTIEYEWERPGVKVCNHGDKEIQGLSLVSARGSVQAEGVAMSSRRHGRETIIWFDLPAGASVRLSAR